MLSQKIAFEMLSRGERNLSELTDYTAHLIEDSAAEFIVESGGWVSRARVRWIHLYVCHRVTVYDHDFVSICGDDDFIDVFVKDRCLQSLHRKQQTKVLDWVVGEAFGIFLVHCPG